ncbi:MAG: hypothetical protein ABFR33_02490, partial [Verrucomicrobiota bacterium]
YMVNRLKGYDLLERYYTDNPNVRLYKYTRGDPASPVLVASAVNGQEVVNLPVYSGVAEVSVTDIFGVDQGTLSVVNNNLQITATETPVYVDGLQAADFPSLQPSFIFQDDFSGSGSSGLDGIVPDVAPAGTTWTAHANIMADGSLGASTAGSAWLPFVPEAGRIYELSATLNAVGSWLSLGFGTGTPTTGRTLDNAVFWSLTQPSGSAYPDQSFTGPGTSGSENASTTSTDYLKVVLDARNADWEVEWYFNGGLERSETVLEANVPSITHVYLSANGATGSYGDFLMTEWVSVVLPAGIVGWESASSNIMEMVVDAPGAANRYFPVATTNLVDGIWTNVPHSDTNTGPFVVTNLGHSTTDASGTNEVIYLQADGNAKFFRIIAQ